jgi:alpha-glucosidase (family GH31 glycosyl hydrolase)
MSSVKSDEYSVFIYTPTLSLFHNYPMLYLTLHFITLQWDKSYFPTPIEMQRNVSKHGRKMVTIIDPHLKRDENYYIHKEASSKGLYVKNKDGGDFDGWCWPGQSSYLDFTSPKVTLILILSSVHYRQHTLVLSYSLHC